MSLTLRFLHGMCHFYGYDNCEKKQQNYQTLAKWYYSMKVFLTLVNGLILVYTGGIVGGATALLVLLFKEIASDIWMIVGDPNGFLTTHCLQSSEQDVESIKDKYDVQRLAEEKLKDYEASWKAYKHYSPSPPKPLVTSSSNSVKSQLEREEERYMKNLKKRQEINDWLDRDDDM